MLFAKFGGNWRSSSLEEFIEVGDVLSSFLYLPVNDALCQVPVVLKKKMKLSEV